MTRHWYRKSTSGVPTKVRMPSSAPERKPWPNNGQSQVSRMLDPNISIEASRHGIISKLLNAPVFFADSYSSWQKGAIENTNKLTRQYIPKGTDFNDITDEYIHSVQLKINRRPREKLNYSTPKDEFFKFLLLCCTCFLTLLFLRITIQISVSEE